MLVSFSVENFRSIGEEVTLSMLASKRLNQHPDHVIPIPGTSQGLVRAAVLYGANAAGKSNVVKAMKFAQNVIISREDESATAQTFSFDPSFSGKPSSFEFRFLMNGRVFCYGFDIANEGIQREWLSVFQGDSEADIFDRDESGIAKIDKSVQRILRDPQSFEMLQKLKQLPLTKQQLFLNRARSIPDESQGETLRGIIQWLTVDLVIFTTQPRSFDMLDRLQNDISFREFSALFMRDVGTGISDFLIIEDDRVASEYDRQYLVRRIQRAGGRPVSVGPWPEHTDSRIDPADPNRIITRTLVSGHANKNSDSHLPFFEESDGTRQLLHLMPVIYPVRGQSKVFVIDELDRSLHPLLCWEFISFFSESLIGAQKQLIVTTHEVHLLDQDLLRRDEYWFVEKDSATQQTRLTSLSDFNVRSDLQLQKGYLRGRFGAIPMIGGMDQLRRLLECGEEKTPSNA